MLKFKKEEDKVQFLIDINRLDLIEESELDENLFEIFIKARSSLVNRFKDFKQSQIQKQNWKFNRWQYLKGIKDFHKSIEGKKLHRAMSRFLASRIFRDKLNKYTTSSLRREESLIDGLKSISSLKTHIYIEREYYMSLEEQVEFVTFKEYVIPLLNNIENNLLIDEDYHPTPDELELLLRLVDIDQIDKLVSEEYDLDFREIFNTSSMDLDETYFYTKLMSLIKDCMSCENRKSVV